MSQSKRPKFSGSPEKKDVAESELPPEEEEGRKLSGAKETDPFEEEGRKMYGAAYSASLFRKDTGFFANMSSFKKFPESLWQHCLTPEATEKGQSIFASSSWRPLTEEEKKARGFYNNTDAFTTPEDREKLRKLCKRASDARTAAAATPQKKLAENSVHSVRSPYCSCKPCCGNASNKLLVSGLPMGASEEDRQAFVPIWIEYKRQIRQSSCFDVDGHPGSDFGAALIPLKPHLDFEPKAGKLKELAEIAIEEYNKKDCNIDKYKFKRIEKVVGAVYGTYYNYWMTVRVLNVSNKTSIETLQIHAYLRTWKDEKTIVFCRRKEEAVDVGLPSCDFCFGKVRKSNAVGVKEV